MNDLLGHWKSVIGEPQDIQATHEKPDGLTVSTHFITAQTGERFVLKNASGRADDQAGIDSEISVLQHLSRLDVPVAVPITTDDNTPFVEDDDGTYLLYPVLPEDGQDAPHVEPEILYTNIGRALAKLHQALATYPGQIDSWTMNLPKTMAEEAVPEIEHALVGEQLESFRRAYASLAPNIDLALADLPTQTIHGDCHGGNYLIYQGDVSGFIDLDHLPNGPRCYDVAYVMADFAKSPLFGRTYHENWIENFTYILEGYEQINALSEHERNALWPMMLCIQLMFAYWLFKYQSEDAAQKNMESFYWLHEREATINEKIAQTYKPETRP